MGKHQVGSIVLMPTVAKSTSAYLWSRMNKKTDLVLIPWKREKAKTTAINHLMAVLKSLKFTINKLPTD